MESTHFTAKKLPKGGGGVSSIHTSNTCEKYKKKGSVTANIGVLKPGSDISLQINQVSHL